MFKRLLKLPVFLILVLPCLLFDCLWILVASMVEFELVFMSTIVNGKHKNKYDDFSCEYGPAPGLLEPLYNWWVK